MNRDIIFRGKHTGSSNWVEGSLLVYADGDCFICCQDVYPDVMNKYEVDPATVGQFTGLVDKNGTKIFEGDIVKDDRLEYRLLCDEKKKKQRNGVAVVKFGPHEVPSDDPFCWAEAYGFYFEGETLYPTPLRYKPYDEYSEGEFEVNGNIHDTPELLQG